MLEKHLLIYKLMFYTLNNHKFDTIAFGSMYSWLLLHFQICSLNQLHISMLQVSYSICTSSQLKTYQSQAYQKVKILV